MRVAIVYESIFGNTREVAESVADGIRAAAPEAEVTCTAVPFADPELAEADLLVLGAPTHALGLPSERTRRMWLRREDVESGRGREGHPLEPGAAGPALRDWLDAVPRRTHGRAAAFDTRLDKRLAGGAAPRLTRRLSRHGYEVVGGPVGFVVGDMEGPLRSGELDRAERWGAGLVRQLVG
jgi:hypothetical protein